jgi:hypothetical protein
MASAIPVLGVGPALGSTKPSDTSDVAPDVGEIGTSPIPLLIIISSVIV